VIVLRFVERAKFERHVSEFNGKNYSVLDPIPV